MQTNQLFSIPEETHNQSKNIEEEKKDFSINNDSEEDYEYAIAVRNILSRTDAAAQAAPTTSKKLNDVIIKPYNTVLADQDESYEEMMEDIIVQYAGVLENNTNANMAQLSLDDENERYQKLRLQNASSQYELQ